MVGKILQTMSPKADKVEVRRIGELDNEMDPVGLVYPSDKSIAAVVFPIAESLKQVCTLNPKPKAPRNYCFNMTDLIVYILKLVEFRRFQVLFYQNQ